MCTRITADSAWVTVSKTVCPMLSDHCLSVLSCLWRWCTVAKRLDGSKLGMQVGLGPGHIVSASDPAPPHPKGQSCPQFSAHICCCQMAGWILLWPNGWMDQDATWYEGRPWHRLHCVTWGPSSPCQKGHSPQFSAHVCCGQTVTHLTYCWALVFNYCCHCYSAVVDSWWREERHRSKSHSCWRFFSRRSRCSVFIFHYTTEASRWHRGTQYVASNAQDIPSSTCNPVFALLDSCGWVSFTFR